MNKSIYIYLISFLITCEIAGAQIKTKSYTSKFLPESVTYNGSPNPNECWESVAWGIRIKTEKGKPFFSISYQAFENLKEKIGDKEVQIEVVYYNEPSDDSGAVGYVKKIIFKGEVIYKNE
jgi:hypothetical protein